MLISRNTSKTILLQSVAQASTMGLAFVTGLLIVRELPKDEYAYYSICISLIAALGLIGEAGVSSVVLSRGGRIPTDSLRFSYLITAARRFRARLSVPVLLLGSILLYAMLKMTGASPAYAIGLSAFAVLSVWTTLSTTVYQNVHRLGMDFSFIRRAALASSAIRLAIFLILMHIVNVDAMVALAIGLTIYLFGYILHRTRAKRTLSTSPTRTQRYAREFARSAQRILPTTLLIVASEQSVIFILATSGATDLIAEISALSRFGVVFTLFNILYADLASPYIARLKLPAKKVATKIVFLALAYLALSLLVWLILLSTAPALLNLLGNQYAHLITPFSIILLGQASLNLGYSVGFLAQARGWTKWSWTYGIFIALWLVLGIAFLDLSTSIGAALLMASQSIPNLLTQVVRITAAVFGQRN